MRKHPQLAKKLSILYELRAHPDLSNNVALSHFLGISKQSISKWCRGSPTSYGDQIPRKQVAVLSDLFDIEPPWWELPFEEFDSLVKEKLHQERALKYIKPEDISVSFLPITNAEVFGRLEEIETLYKCWKNSQVNLVQLTGFGGIGKSTIVNAWLSNLAKESYVGSQRVYGWSFHWQGSGADQQSSGDFFIEHALNWFGDPSPMEGTPWGKAARLVRLVRASKTILVLDGIEPMQFGPGSNLGQIENPAIAFLIKELACENPGLCVLTSRMRIADLASFDDGRVASITVGQLSITASKSMLESLGVLGTDYEFDRALRAVGGHALSLSLLAGYLQVVYKSELERFSEINSLLDNQTQGNHARALLQAYFDWYADTIELELLYLLGMFDRGVSIEDLQAICSKNEIDGLTLNLSKFTHKEWMYSTRMLYESRIISQDIRGNSVILDCHPLVRDFIYEKLAQNQSPIWKSGNEAIFEYLESIAAKSTSKVEELEILFRAVIHGTRASRYQSAFDVYFYKIKKQQFSVPTGSSHHADQMCIRAFFLGNSVHTPSILEGAQKYFILSSAAANLIYLGKINESITLSEKSITWYLAESKWLEAVGMAAPLLSMLIAAGKLRKSFELMKNLEQCISNTENLFVQAMADNFHAYMMLLSGKKEESGLLFKNSEQFLNQSEPKIPIHFPTISAYYCLFLLLSDQGKEALERSLKTKNWRDTKSWQVTIDTTSLLASDLIVLGLAFLENGDLENAKLNLDKQVSLLRSSDEWLYLPTGLNARATYFIRCKEFDAAKIDLEDALAISLKTGANFGAWESYLNLAQLNYAQRDYHEALNNLKYASALEGMGEYKFRDQEIVELKSKIRERLKK